MKLFTFFSVALTACITVIAQDSLPPSPTESIGCEVHDDHWHCEGPAAPSTSAPSVTSADSESAITLEPSPTGSIGCEPHGDHWHCEGPATTSASGDHDHDDEQPSASVTPAGPSPTESIGCEPHGDHWHCEGPATTSASSDHDHDDEQPSATITPTEPSPTESVGCEPHGDHWHCEGPAETGMTTTTSMPPNRNETMTSDPPTFTGAAGYLHSDARMVAVVAVAAVACYV